MSNSKTRKGRADANIVSIEEEEFVSRILMGESGADAFRNTFPHSQSWTAQSVTSAAWRLRRKQKIKDRIEERRKEILALQDQEFKWTYDKSVKELMTVINRANTDLDRVDFATNEQLQYIEMMISKYEDDDSEEGVKERNKWMSKYFSTKKSRRVTLSQTDSIIKAASELNKMHGFNNTTNITGTATVIFKGEEDLID